jgi:excisionase family DNA binding protein
MSTSPSHPVLRHAKSLDKSERVPEAKDAAVPKVLNLAEAAALVRCSRAHLCNIVHGKIPGIPVLPTVRIGRRVLFRRESLEQWLEAVEAVGPRRVAS